MTDSRRPGSGDSRTTRLRSTGLRRTGPRLVVLERLEQARSPLSHGEIAAALQPLGFDRATIYRVLMDLTEAGLVRRTDLGDHMWRFELVREDIPKEASHHPHLVCTDCGQVSCLEDVKVSVQATARGKKPAILAQNYEVQLRGRCGNCG